MKPRHVRRLAVALAACGALLLVASFLPGMLDDGVLQGAVKDKDGDTPPAHPGPDDPGGFHRFQEALVRRKAEEHALAQDSAEDAVDVSEREAASIIRAASRWNEHRLQRVQEVCARHNLGLYRSSAVAPDFKLPPTPQYAVFYYDRSHKMAWCPLYKAGSTSWLYNLCLLGGYSERELQATQEQLSTLARKAFPELEYPEAEEALRGSRKILVVRHPLARLLSAYRDKLENRVAGAEHGTAHFYRKYGRRIVDKYRAKKDGVAVATSSLLQPGHVVRDPAKPAPADDEPTFKEFVKYLIDVDLANYADDHWIPYYLFCTPCLLNYDIIAKVETYLEDQVYMIRALGLQDTVKPRWRHRTSPQGPEGLPSSSPQDVSPTARAYFAQITEHELRALHQKYKLDFEMFDYAMEDYLPYVSPN
ncbi:carbohydrate sulfotransferase 11-like [Thrips palmi]|uniref:Carbohydrate sulfotransferase n=1 Tax=Thrips palmi TaxID=161013 RepID=A0A6P8ZUM5_THRPL|nr:carbohydrate sulfotransferase 11-like [Thrips palmi]